MIWIFCYVKNYFSYVFQNNLIFCPLFYTPKLCNADYVKVTSWKSVGVSTEEIRLADTTLTPKVKYSTRIKKGLKFNKLFNKKLTYVIKKGLFTMIMD